MPRSRGAALFSSWNRPPFIRETAPIFGRTHAQGALERAAHRFARAEAALRGNLVDGGPALFQSPPRPFDAQFLDIARGRDACRSGEHASEIARARVRAGMVRWCARAVSGRKDNVATNPASKYRDKGLRLARLHWAADCPCAPPSGRCAA